MQARIGVYTTNKSPGTRIQKWVHVTYQPVSKR